MTADSHIRFRRWSGEGALGVQVNLPVKELLGGQSKHAQLELDSFYAARLLHSSGKKRRSKRERAFLSLRIGTDGREPVWAKFPLIYHRDLPPAAVIKWVRVHCVKAGGRARWTAQFVLEASAGGFRRQVLRQGDTLAIDIGWRKLSNGEMRVAVWRDSERVPTDSRQVRRNFWG